MKKESNVKPITIEVTLSPKIVKELACDTLYMCLHYFDDKQTLKAMGYTQQALIETLATDEEFCKAVKKAMIQSTSDLDEFVGENLCIDSVKFIDQLEKLESEVLKKRHAAEESTREAEAEKLAIDRLKALGYTVTKK